MEKNKINITEAELEIMNVLWKNKEPMTAQQVSSMIKSKEWKYSTIATLFSRMVDKGTVSLEANCSLPLKNPENFNNYLDFSL